MIGSRLSTLKVIHVHYQANFFTSIKPTIYYYQTHFNYHPTHFFTNQLRLRSSAFHLWCEPIKFWVLVRAFCFINIKKETVWQIQNNSSLNWNRFKNYFFYNWNKKKGEKQGSLTCHNWKNYIKIFKVKNWLVLKILIFG